MEKAAGAMAEAAMAVVVKVAESMAVGAMADEEVAEAVMAEAVKAVEMVVATAVEKAGVTAAVTT